MASPCAQICLGCRNLLFTKSLGLTWLCSSHISHCSAVTTVTVNGPSFVRDNHTSATVRQRWKHQIFCHSDITSRHLTTEATEDKCTQVFSKNNVVAYKSPLFPVRDTVSVTESQMSLGMYGLLVFGCWLYQHNNAIDSDLIVFPVYV